MICKNCGAQLMGMEHACPVCGTPVVHNPAVVPTPVMIPPEGAQSVYPEGTATVNPMEGVPMTYPEGTPVEETETSKEDGSKKDNKLVAIIILVVAVAAIAVGVFLAITDKDDNVIEDKKPTENVETYAGYTFHLPLSYQVNVKDHLGLMIVDSKYNTFTIGVDYTNSYSDYKTYFTTNYPNDIGRIITNISDREYLVVVIKDGEGGYGIQYMTATPDEEACFIGEVVKPDFSKIVNDELYVLNEFLDNAEKKGEVEMGSIEDSGRDGIKIRTLVKEDFTS